MLYLPTVSRSFPSRTGSWLRTILRGSPLVLACSGCLCAETATPAPAAGTLVERRLTDGQDRPMAGTLAPASETKARADALYAEALVLLDAPEKNVTQVLTDLREVAALDPHFDEVPMKIADLLLQAGEIEPAFEQLRQAAEANPRSAGIESMLGYAQHLRGNDAEATRLGTQALTRDPTQAVAMRALLEIAGDQNDLAGAVVRIEDILKESGASAPASAWLALGQLYMEVARNEPHPASGDSVLRTLLPIYREAAAKSPPDAERLTLLAETYADLGRKEEALKTMRQAGGLEPGNVDMLLRCARLEMDLEQKTEALRDYQQAYDFNPNLAGLRDLLGRLYLENDRFADAKRILQDALADEPDDSDLMADLGVACEGANDPAQAQAWFQRAFASPNCPPEAYLKLAVFQLSNRQVPEAGRTLATAQARFPQSAQILFYQAIQNRYAKNYSTALACLKGMRSLASPSETDVFSPNYYLEGALTMSLAGQDGQIEPWLKEGLGKYPRNPDLMNELAYSWADHDEHLSDALALSEQAARLDPDNGAIQDTWGWVYFKMGKANAALPYLQRAAVLTDNDPVVLEHVGDAFLKLGHRHEALAAWRHALQKAPSDHRLATRIIAAQAQANHAYPRSAPNQ
jgi:tetratricopeptide (TPR) repeat protein